MTARNCVLFLTFLFMTISVYGQEGSFYYKYQQKKMLTKDVSQVSVKVIKGANVKAGLAAVSLASYFDFTNVKEVGLDVYKLHLRSGISGKAAIDYLIGMDEVVSVHPLYLTKDEGAELYMTDEICVQFLNGTSEKDIERIVRSQRLTVRRRLDVEPYFLFAVPKDADALEVANKIALEKGVLFSHPNFYTNMLKRSYMPTDRWFNRQFNMYNYGQRTRRGFGTAGADIKMIQSWDITRGNASILVTVIDDGLDLTHEDISSSKIVPGYDFADHDASVQPIGENAHGTNCSGQIAADHNSIGVAGISPNSRLQMMKIFGDGGSGGSSDDLAWAIDSARGSGADVMSNSWGYSSTDTNLVPVVRQAIIRAKTLGRGGLGCVVVFAAGNTADRPSNVGIVTFPGSMSEVITVGASSRNDDVALYSPNSNPTGNLYIELTAPSHKAYDSQDPNEGFELWSTDVSGTAGYNAGTSDTLIGDVAGNYDGDFGGTSGACPQVAGAAALILGINSYLTANEVAQILISSADTVGGYNYHSIPARPGASLELGYGRLNVYRALLLVVDPTDPKPVTAASAYSDYTTPTSIDLIWTDPSEFSNGTPIDTFVIDIYRADTLRGTVPKGTESFTETGLIDGTPWTYKLKVRHIPTDSLSIVVETAPWYVGGHPVPNGATNLQVTSDVTSAYLTWHNPTTNIDGTPIDDLDSIRIFRNGIHIANVEYTGIADSSFTDVIYTLDGAYYTYKVQVIDNETPVNAGAFSNEAQVYVGPVPAISVNPDTLFFNLVTGLSDTSSYWIYNTGGDTLKVSGIRAEEITTEKYVPTWIQPQKYTPAYTKGSVEPYYGAITEGSGGPDPFGYKWKDSDEPGGSTYNWTDISGIGTAITFSENDDAFTPVTLPFTFKYYGTDYTSINVCTNGFINFGTGSDAFSNAAIPNVAAPNGFIAGLWDDLTVESGGVKYYHDSGNDRFIVQFNVHPLSSTSTNYIFQIILYQSGKILVQYNTKEGSETDYTVGIESPDGTMGLQVSHEQAYLHNGLAIVYQKNVEWLVQSPTAGNIPPGDSLEITTIVNATGLVGATYNAKVIIDHNIPLTPAYEHPLVSMLVTGATDIGVTPDTLDFGTNFITIPDTLQFTVSNTGTDTLHVSSMMNDSLQFTILGPNAYDIPVGGSREVNVVFTSAFAGSFEDRVTITSDGSSGTKYVYLFGEAVEMPELTVMPDSLYFNINPAMLDSAYIGLFNTGLGVLDISNIELEEITTEGTFVQPQNITPDYPKGVDGPVHGSVTEGSGGPDPYGYKWKDSDAPGGPAVNFIDISGTGTQITSWTGTTDDGRASIPLPFPVKFYGNTYSGNITVGTNGYISFDAHTTYYYNAGIPSINQPNNLIAMYWDDLNGSTTGSVYYGTVGNKFIVQFKNWQRWNSTGSNLNFEVILTQNSDKVELQYGTIVQGSGTTNSHTIGIENSGGTMGLQVVYDAAYIKSNHAIVFSKGVDWLTVSPLTGTIASGDSMMVKALVNSTGLSNGLYQARLIIGSTDPVTPTQYAKVTLNVGTVDVDPDLITGPVSYALHQNYPNPFNPTTTIKYDLKDAGKVSLKIYNILGQEVRSLVNKNETAGFKSVVWDGKDNAGRMVSSGLYIYRLEAGRFVKSHKMMFLK